MNDRMRRYLDEDLDLNDELEQERDRADRRPGKPLAQERRQQSKEWGRAHAKWHRERRKAGLVSNKP